MGIAIVTAPATSSASRTTEGADDRVSRSIVTNNATDNAIKEAPTTRCEVIASPNHHTALVSPNPGARLTMIPAGPAAMCTMAALYSRKTAAVADDPDQRRRHPELWGHLGSGQRFGATAPPHHSQRQDESGRGRELVRGDGQRVVVRRQAPRDDRVGRCTQRPGHDEQVPESRDRRIRPVALQRHHAQHRDDDGHHHRPSDAFTQEDRRQDDHEAALQPGQQRAVRCRCVTEPETEEQIRQTRLQRAEQYHPAPTGGSAISAAQQQDPQYGGGRRELDDEHADRAGNRPGRTFVPVEATPKNTADRVSAAHRPTCDHRCRPTDLMTARRSPGKGHGWAQHPDVSQE